MSEQEQKILDAIRSFAFDDYGMDGVEQIKDEEWAPDLARHIAAALHGED